MVPYLNGISKSKAQLVNFRGYNANIYAGDGEFSDMCNMSGDHYPVLSTRQKRGKYRKLTKANGLFAKEKLAWVDGKEVYYDGVHIGDVETDGEKQFASMGAYLLIFPDKMIYNTYTGKYRSMVAEDAVYAVPGGNIVSDNERFKAGQKIEALFGNLRDRKRIFQIVEVVQDPQRQLSVVDVETGETPDYEGAFDDPDVVSVSFDIRTIVPDMDFIVESENRLWGCSSQNHEIYACKLGEPEEWNCFEGISTDSYAVTVGTDGDFTGAAVHLSYVMFFKEDCVHAIYGTRPSNFQITTTKMQGVEKGSSRSLSTVNGALYYKSPYGICRYSGSIPQDVSEALGNERYGKAQAGAFGDRLYVSMEDGQGNWKLYVFCERTGLWHVEDTVQARYFTPYEGNLYYLQGNDIMAVRCAEGMEKETDFEWSAKLYRFDEGSLDRKYISKLQFRLALDEGAWMEVWLSYDGSGEWERVMRIDEHPAVPFTVPVLPRRCDTMELKMAGYGGCRILGIAKVVEGGSEM